MLNILEAGEVCSPDPFAETVGWKGQQESDEPPSPGTQGVRKRRRTPPPPRGDSTR